MSELHGFRLGEETIHITHLPRHKKPVLLIGNGYCSQKIASFDSEECAKGFCKLLDKWLGIIDEAESGVLEQIAEEQNSLIASCKAWGEAIDKAGYVN